MSIVENPYFILSPKEIQNLFEFHKAIASLVPEFVGLMTVGSEVRIELSVEPTQELIDQIEAIVPPVESLVPRSVTNQQLRQALILKAFQEGHPEFHPDAIRQFILSLPEPTKSLAFNFWEYSNEMFRNNALLNQLSPMLGLTQTDLDNLFIKARTL